MTAIEGLAAHQQLSKPHKHLLFYRVFVLLSCICLVFHIDKILESLHYVMQQFKTDQLTFSNNLSSRSGISQKRFVDEVLFDDENY